MIEKKGEPTFISELSMAFSASSISYSFACSERKPFIATKLYSPLAFPTDNLLDVPSDSPSADPSLSPSK